MTRYGREAVIIVSEAEWTARPRSAGTLGALLARHARSTAADDGGDAIGGAFAQERPLGADFD